MSTIIFVSLPHLQRSILFFSRQIRHIYAKSSEWYRVHRSGGGNGWNYLWLLAGLIFACWLAYKVFIWLVQVIRVIIHGVCECVLFAVPFVLLGLIVLAVGMWLMKRRQQ